MVRMRRTTWKEFLRTHWDVLAATDFFTVEIWSAAGLARYHVWFVLQLATRTVAIAGIVPEPTGFWVAQKSRYLTDGLDGFLKGCRYLIHDRSPLFTNEFATILVWRPRFDRFDHTGACHARTLTKPPLCV